MKPILEVRGISKKYNIHHEGKQPYLSLRDSLSNLFIKGKNSDEEFWALKDISFDIYPGESVGIIGRNGAGKSTLLKILSKITPPSSGKITARGRIASLLEVGTGFHTELSGRENIYLNGSILGLKKKEIDKQFDAIVDFSGVEFFLDTPLKHYSSGMQLRLAFAVAAHLEPEVLIIDEVLAVGDVEFQKRCIGKMDEVSKSGRTVIFVSHHMDLLRKLCNKGLLLKAGNVIYEGNIFETIKHYETGVSALSNSGIWKNDSQRDKIKPAYINRIEVKGRDQKHKDSFLNTESIFVEFEVIVKDKNPLLKIGYDLIKNNRIVYRSQNTDNSDSEILEIGTHLLVVEIPPLLLNLGKYYIKPLITIHCIESLNEKEHEVLFFNMTLDSNVSHFHGILNESNHPGEVFPILKWNRK